MKRSLIWDKGILALFLTTLKVNSALMVVLFFFSRFNPTVRKDSMKVKLLKKLDHRSCTHKKWAQVLIG